MLNIVVLMNIAAVTHTVVVSIAEVGIESDPLDVKYHQHNAIRSIPTGLIFSGSNGGNCNPMREQTRSTCITTHLQTTTVDICS